MHGGSVTAASPGEGKGSTFVVSLPLSGQSVAETVTSPLTAVRTSDLNLPDGAILNGLRILLVDDEPDALEVLSLVLEHRGGDVKATTTAREALEALDHWAPDVIVSDIGMPETDGFELLSSIRSLPAEKGGAAPAIALTAYTREEDKLRAEQCGFQLHLAKPLDPEAVVAAVADLMSDRGTVQ
jgi:CheY-like chemotaxis protein